MHPAVRLLPVCLLLLCAACSPPAARDEATPESTSLTRVGQAAPDFELATLDGGSFRLADQRGKVVLVNFFATWCPPCRQEMPFLEQEVWRRFGPEGLVLLSISRGETAAEVDSFGVANGLTFPLAVDPDRGVFGLFAEAFIPRNYVIGPQGSILFQSQGFERPDFDAMIGVIAGALADGRAATGR